MTPIDVYKKLPRNNCGKCPAGTCMAFAVQVLRRLASLEECDKLDSEGRKEIEAMLSEPGDWKERRLEELINDVASVNFSHIAETIGAVVDNGLLKIRYLGKEITLSQEGFRDDLDVMDKLLILTYVKKAGSGVPSGKWVAFRDLKDGMIRAEGFHGASEMPLAKMLGHAGELLINKLSALGAEKVDGFSTELSYKIYLLPNIPFLALLWPKDEDFEADCTMLIDSTATDFIDVEALLYLGMALVRTIKDSC
jgi:hypothetical protein